MRKFPAFKSAVPKAVHALGRKIVSSVTLCMETGMRSIKASVSKSAPMVPAFEWLGELPACRCAHRNHRAAFRQIVREIRLSVIGPGPATEHQRRAERNRIVAEKLIDHAVLVRFRVCFRHVGAEPDVANTASPRTPGKSPPPDPLPTGCPCSAAALGIPQAVDLAVTSEPGWSPARLPKRRRTIREPTMPWSIL